MRTGVAAATRRIFPDFPDKCGDGRDVRVTSDIFSLFLLQLSAVYTANGVAPLCCYKMSLLKGRILLSANEQRCKRRFKTTAHCVGTFGAIIF